MRAVSSLLSREVEEMKRIISVMTLVMAFFAMPALVHAQTPPPECVGLPASAWVDVQQSSMSVTGNSSVVGDALASDGLAAQKPWWVYDWDIQYQIPASLVGRWHCYVRMRVDAAASSGLAFQMGIQNSSAYKEIYLQDGAADQQYHTYDLGVLNLTQSMYFWFSSFHDPATVLNVYLDRLFFVRNNSVSSIGGMAALANNTDITMNTPLVAVTSPGTFTDGSGYLETDNRATGIRCVYATGVQAPNLGDRVTFSGTMATDAVGQRYVVINSISKVSGEPLGALGA